MAGWASAVKLPSKKPVAEFLRPTFTRPVIDWARLIALDFESYWDADYTLRKMSTSEYVRDPRFKAHMVGIKIGNKKTRVVPAARIKLELAGINWGTHDLLCHNTAFDGFVLSHHFGIIPRAYYDTLSMARGLHSNDIGASLDEVAVYYGVGNKIPNVLEQSKGIRDIKGPLLKSMSAYCAQDVDLTIEIFKRMLENYPNNEIRLIDMTIRMFCDPVLKIDIPRVEVELARELKEREDLLLAIDTSGYDDKKLKLAERSLPDHEKRLLKAKKIVGSSEQFADLLRALGVTPPLKISPAWIKMPKEERTDKKYAYAFAKDDQDFIDLPARVEEWGADLDLNTKKGAQAVAARQDAIQALIDTRIAVKSTTNITRAERFLTAGANGMALPVGYAYYRAHTGRWGGNNKMNMQNLKRGGELRLSILAPKGHVLIVGDSGQIECRVNGWLWGQDDLMQAFRDADAGVGRDAYCNFADHVYGRTITKDDKMERFVGKVCLGPETLVYTNRGLKPIVDVRSTDSLWDGESWVKHDGLLDQGRKETLTCRGLCATPDHEILTERGWQAWSGVLINPLLFRSALSLATLPSCDGAITAPPMGSLGGTAQFASARAGQRLWSIPAASKQAEQLGVTHAQRSLPVQNGTGFISMLWKMMSTAHGCSIDFRQRLVDALGRATRRTFTMVDGASQFVRNGVMTEQPFFGMFKPSPAGTSPSLKWIGEKPTKGTNPAISGLLPKAKMQKTSAGSKTSNNESAIWKQITQTYDLANAGPNQRFTVHTDDGPVIVHNCVLGLGFQMGAPKFQVTLAKGALGGPPVYFPLDRCKGIVTTYRRKNWKIEAGWEICKRIIEDMAAGRTGSYKCLSWEHEHIWLPNGMCLKYPDLKKAVNDKGWDEWSYQSKDQRKKIYGGLLCENIVQALARIVVGEQLLLVAPRRRIVMITHDEGVLCTRKAAAETAYKELMKAMRTPLDWCLDLPLNSEGGYAENYSK